MLKVIFILSLFLGITKSKAQSGLNADNNDRYILFITSKKASSGQKGYFLLGGQFGYIFDNADDKTPAHEIGHGVFKLEHPWNAYGSKEAKTNLLMDYASGTMLSFLEWKQINDPKLKIYAFQKQQEGEFKEVRLTPDWVPFEYTGSSLHGSHSKCINNGGICSILKNNTEYKYDYNQKDYFYNNHKLGISIVQNPDNVLVVDYSVGCGKLYKVNFSDLKTKFNVSDTNINFNDNIFTFYADIDCVSNGVLSQDVIKKQLKEISKQFGNNVEFAKNGKVYKQNTNGEIEEVTNPLTKEQINSGEWTDNEDQKIRFTTNENDIIQVEAFGFHNKMPIAKGKSADLKKLSDNIRKKTNDFLIKNKAKDLADIYRDETPTFADGGKIEIKGTFANIIAEGIGISKNLLKTGEIPQNVYLQDSKAYIKAPGLVTGSTEVVAQKVTDLTSLGVLVYDIATDKKVREDLQEQFREIKNQIGENPKEFFPILGEVILAVTTGNTSEEWQKAVHSKDIGERSHLATRGTGNAIITTIAGVAIVKDLPKIAKKIGEKIKEVKKINLNKVFLKNLDDTIDKLKSNAKFELEGTGEYSKVKGHHPIAKKAFEGVVEYDYNKAFSVSPKTLNEISGVINIHHKITGQQSQLYTAWRKANPNKTLEIDDMAEIEIKAMVNVGIPEDIATGWVVKALEDLKSQGVTAIKNIPWNGVNN